MAKHDQRILKFLTQNADRAPTITEMMTRLNISISDISDSLSSLLSQGLINKRTNNQGIECWFPVGSTSSLTPSSQSTPPIQAKPEHLQYPSGLSTPAVGEGRLNADIRASVDTRPWDLRFGGQQPEKTVLPVEPAYPAPKSEPVPVHHIPTGERAVTQTQSFHAIPFESSAAEPPGSSPTGLAGYVPMSKPESKGIGIATFAVGLIAAMAFSTWLAGRLASNKIYEVQRSFVDQKALSAANSSFKDFEVKTKAHINALEDKVNKLEDQLAASQAAAESLKIAMAEQPVRPTSKSRADEGTKTKARKAQLGRSSTKSSASLAPAAALRKKKKAPAPSSASVPASREGSSPSENESSASNNSEAGPNVPTPPGLYDQDLPPAALE